MVDLRVVGQCFGQVALKSLQLGLQGANPAVELAVAYEVGEVRAEVRVGEPVKVPLAAEARPLREDCEG